MDAETLKEKLDHSLLICPQEYKNRILEALYEEKMVCDVKFMTLEEYRKKYYFDHDIRAVRYLMDSHSLSIANAREILENLIYVEADRTYGNDKLDQLVAYRKQLDELGLLIYDPLFLPSIKGRMVLVMGYGKLGQEDEKIIDGQIEGYELIEKKYRISCFEDIEEEVAHLFEEVYDLLEKGTDINDIHVLNGNGDYESYFRRFNAYYGFSIAYPCQDALIGCRLSLDLLEKIGECDRKEIYDWLSSLEDPLAEKLIGIINRYPEYELEDVKDLIIDDLENTKIDSTVYRDAVNCSELFHCFSDKDHVFLLGFNDSFPVLRRDIAYITDDLAPVVGKDRTEEANALTRENVRAYLSSIKDLRISYCRKSPFKNYEISNLFDAGEYELIETERRYDHNDSLNRVRLAYMLDDLNRYGDHDQDLDLLYNMYPDEDHYSYDNRFSGLNERQLAGIGKIRLSYSSMDKFYKCAFAYYIENILGLNSYEDTFYTMTGTLCHEVLKDLFNEDAFDFDRSWEKNLKALNERGTSFADAKEAFFAERIKEELREDVRIILEQKAKTALDQQLCEKDFNIRVSDRLIFKGFIDKVMYKELDDQIIVDVVDYKTGSSAAIKEKLMDFGLSLQLPSYMYLLRKDDPFGKRISYGGFYLQHLISNDRRFDEERDLEEIKKDSMKLEGFSSSDMERMRYCDRTLYLGSSEIIKGLKVKKDGSFHSSSKTKSDAQMDEMIANVERKVDEAGKRIFAGDFRIDPKQIDGVNESCGYCPYASLCYKRYSDLCYLSSRQEEEDDA